MEAAEDEELTIEKSIFANVRPAACTGPPKRSTHTASHTRPSNVLHFGSDQQGIGSCRRYMEAAEEEVPPSELVVGEP